MKARNFAGRLQRLGRDSVDEIILAEEDFLHVDDFSISFWILSRPLPCAIAVLPDGKWIIVPGVGVKLIVLVFIGAGRIFVIGDFEEELSLFSIMFVQVQITHLIYLLLSIFTIVKLLGFRMKFRVYI